MVAVWICNFLDKPLQNSFTLSDAKAIWEELKQCYSQGNAPRVHKIKTEVCLLQQETKSMTEYFAVLKCLWDELDDYSKPLSYTCDAAQQYVK